MKEKYTSIADLPLGISLQDKYGLGGTEPSDYVYDKDGNVKRDTACFPVKRINSYFTTDIKIDGEK